MSPTLRMRAGLPASINGRSPPQGLPPCDNPAKSPCAHAALTDAGPASCCVLGSDSWGKWRHRREERWRTAILDELVRDITKEVARQMQAGALYPLVPSDVIQAALSEAIRRGWGPDTPDPPSQPWLPHTMQRMVGEVLDREKRAWSATQAPDESLEVRMRRDQQWRAKARAEEQERQSARQGEADAASRRKRADEAAALQTFEDSYERRVRSLKDSGGKTVWPTKDAVIASLFGSP